MNARYYVPEVGRFASPDTLVPDPNNPQSFNRYGYALNNPVNHTDPSGHCIFGLDTAVCIAIGAGILKVVDYGWTAYDTWQAGRTLTDPTASRDVKMMAGLTVSLSILFETIEPDDLLPVGLPADDIARRTVMKGAQGALEEGGPEALEGFLRKQLGDSADDVLQKLDELAGITAPTNHNGLRKNLGDPPSGFSKPQAHHDLPWAFREWFAGPGRGLNVNDIGRWVEGNPIGSHQSWSRQYNRLWADWIAANPSASRQQVLDFMNELIQSGNYH